MKLFNNTFLKDFIQRDGLYIFTSSILTKVANFFLSIIIVRFINKTDYGNLTYAMSIIVFASGFKGFGLNHSLLRFGSIEKDKNKQKSLYLYSLKYGMLGSLFFILIIILFSKYLVINKPNSYIYLILLSIGLLTSFPYLLLLSKLRITNKNKQFSKVQFLYSFLSLLIIGFFTYKYAAFGNVLGTLLVPILIFVFFTKDNIFKIFNKLKSMPLNFSKNKPYFKYALFVGFGAIASQFAIISDNLIIGNLISNPEKLAIYKVATLIPMNLVFLPNTFLTTDFVYLANNYLNTRILKSYYFNYLKIFIPITILISVVLWSLSNYYIPFLFGEKYIDAIKILEILIFGLIALFLLRIPLGNILAAIGKANWNTYNAFFLVLLNIPLTIIFVINYGVIGAAYATIFVFWISGLISLGLFYYYLKKIK